MAGKVKYAQFLHDASELLFTETPAGDVQLQMPVIQPNTPVPVIELFLN
jgi:alpha-L-fucosidase